MQAKKTKTPNQKTNQTAPTLTVRQPPVNIWQFLAGTRRFQISASFQKRGLPSTVWAASQHGVTLPATAAWIHSGGKKTFKLILTHRWKLPVKVLWFTNLLSCYKQTFLFMIVSQGAWEPPCIFPLLLAYQYSWKTHTLASLYFLPSHNHKPSLQPQSAFGSCDTERMAHVVKCAGKFPAGPIQPSLMWRIWCQIAAVVLRLLSITLISPVSSFLSPSLSPPAVFFSFLFFFFTSLSCILD